jgi:hypothetical protein
VPERRRTSVIRQDVGKRPGEPGSIPGWHEPHVRTVFEAVAGQYRRCSSDDHRLGEGHRLE